MNEEVKPNPMPDTSLDHEVAVADIVTHYRNRVWRLKLTLGLVSVAFFLTVAVTGILFVQDQSRRVADQDERDVKNQQRRNVDDEFRVMQENEEFDKKQKKLNNELVAVAKLHKETTKKLQDQLKREKALEKEVADARAEVEQLRKALDLKTAEPGLNDIKKNLKNEMTAALDKTDEQIKALHKRLADAQEAAALASDLAHWQMLVTQARDTWKRAAAIAAVGPSLLPDALMVRLDEQGKQLKVAEQDLDTAQQLDEVRLKAQALSVTPSKPASVGPAYGKIFTNLGIDVAKGNAIQLGKKIEASPNRGVLIAALDDWAQRADDPALTTRLLAISRQADPDPWRDQVRDPKHWNDLAALQKLAATAKVEQQTPPILILLAGRLGAAGGNGTSLLRQALVMHPADFWLHFTLGTMLKDPAEQIGFYQAALAIRPVSAVTHNNLGVALLAKGDRDGALFHFQKAIALDPQLAVTHVNLAAAEKKK